MNCVLLGGHVFLVVADASAKVEGQGAVLLSHLVLGPDHVVAAILGRRVRDGQPDKVNVGVGLLHAPVEGVLAGCFCQLLVGQVPLDVWRREGLDLALQVKLVPLLP